MNRQIYAEASEWLIELRAGDMDLPGRERFDTWLRASPQNIQAFLEVAGIWEEGDDPELDCYNSRGKLIERARRGGDLIALEIGGLLPLHSPVGGSIAPAPAGEVAAAPTSAAAPTKASTRPFRWHSIAAALLLACALPLSAYLYTQHNLYVTGIGEQRTVMLQDGSTVELNSRSRVKVRFSRQGRDVDLLEGQALFRVARDSARPFVVHSDAARVQALGTEFDVYRSADGTRVTVIEGRVAVYSGSPAVSQPVAAAAAPMVLLSAGEQVVAAPAAVSRPRRADMAVATAWSQRELIFDSTTLADVALEFNRYNRRQLVVEDAKLKDFHVTGVFSSTDPASLLRFLRAQPEIRVEERGEQLRILSK